MVSFHSRRRAGAAVAGALAAVFSGIRPAFAYNCVSVVLRDPYWGQFRRVIEQGWNAAGIPRALEGIGFQVDGTPSSGAVISWPPGQYGASSVGHVGVVTQVHGDGTVQILHENWPYGAPAHLKNVVVRPGMLFVHVPPAPEAAADVEPAAPAA